MEIFNKSSTVVSSNRNPATVNKESAMSLKVSNAHPIKYLRILPLLCIAGLSLATGAAQAIGENFDSQAVSEDAFLGKIQPPPEQTLGHGQSALWVLSDVATQYQPVQPTPALQAAIQAQQEGRFLDALILLDEADKSGQASDDAAAEINLLRASFLLQGNQSRQALTILVPLLGNTQHAADAYALTAMAHLQQGQMTEALDMAQHAQGQGKNMRGGMLPPLALSYALQGMGRLAEASAAMHGFNAEASNTGAPQAVALAREAELALTLDQIQQAKALVNRAQTADAAHPYVIAVSGLAWLIDGHAKQAKAAFETALQRDPKDARALLGLALAEIKLGNFQAGQKKLQAADEAAPGNALILTYLGRAQQQSGQTGAARASWRSAQQADPKDPTPWLYQAQAELQANRLQDARESLREAQARTEYRQVYRGARLLGEDEQLLQANLAEIQRRLGLDSIAFHTLTASASEKNAANLRNQADLLQGQRFGESARRSLLLQSLFNDRPGNLPATLDIYGDGAGQTGASTPQHGAVSGLSAQQASYNNYDELFGGRTTLEADAVAGSKNTSGEQIRLGVGNDTLGLGIAGLQFKSDGFAPFEYLDNRVAQATVQWHPLQSTQAFVSYQAFNSRHGETFLPEVSFGYHAAVEDNSYVTRLGLRHSLTEQSELRALWSQQQTDQTRNNKDFADPPTPWSVWSDSGSSGAHSAELQYRRSGADYATQWGVQQTHAQLIYRDATGVSFSNDTQIGKQVYAAWQQALNPHWQLDAGLGLGKVENQDNATGVNNTSLTRWLPKLGAIYTPDSGTHLRLATWQGMGSFAVGDATLAPITLAGILLTRPEDNRPTIKLVKGVALSADKQLSHAWLLAAETQQRKMNEPRFDSGAGQQYLFITQVDESRLALHWQPQDKPWGMSLAYDDERIQNDPRDFVKDSVSEQRLRSQQLALHWFAGAQCTVSLAWSHNLVAGMEQYDGDWGGTNYPISRAYQDGFNQLDADLSWQFARSGSLNAGVRNAADTHFKYTEIDKLNPRFSNGRMVYAKLKFAW